MQHFYSTLQEPEVICGITPTAKNPIVFCSFKTLQMPYLKVKSYNYF